MAQAGIPFTTGFLAKLEVVEASVKANSTALAVVAMVTAVIAAFFYLRVILLMYSSSAGLGGAGAADGSEEPMPSMAMSTTAGGGAVLSTAAVTVEEAAPSTGEEGTDGGARLPVPPTVAAAIAVCVAVTVLFGLWPAPIVSFAHHAVLYSKPFG
jgi:NADH-quinone oxidoreductase subunit N